MRLPKAITPQRGQGIPDGALLAENSGSHFDPACVQAFLDEWNQAMEIRESLMDEPQEPEF